MEKAQIRKRMREFMEELCADDAMRASFSCAACENALLLQACKSANTVFCYMPTRNELDVSNFIATALSDGKRVAFPVCFGEYEMHAYEPKSKDAWTTGAYGIREPKPDMSVLLAPEDIDIALIPGLAFDAQGYRLGRGGGYYDRYLMQTNAYRLGICADGQIVTSTLPEPHDMRMDAIVTDKRIIELIK